MGQISDGVVPVLEAAEAAAGGRGGEADGVSSRAMRRHRHVFQHAGPWDKRNEGFNITSEDRTLTSSRLRRPFGDQYRDIITR